MKAHPKKQPRHRRGIVLVLVLVVVVLLSLAAYTFSDLMVTERDATLLHGEKIQAQCLVQSGVDMVRLYLSQDYMTRLEAGGHLDNPTQFQGVLVVDDPDPSWRGRFTVTAPALDVYGLFDGIRYGLEDESTRINLNALIKGKDLDEETQHELLMAMPGMTDDVADAILDWIDEDDEPREFGAEWDYYSQLQPSYKPKNGPLDTVDELLLVRGVTPGLLFGLDANHNNMVDAYEQQAGLESAAAKNTGFDFFEFDGALDRGWSAYLTLYSAERNADSTGYPRVFVNSEDMEALYDELSAVMDADWATFIVAYRQNGPYQEGGDQGQRGEGSDEPSREGGDAGGGAGAESPAQFQSTRLSPVPGPSPIPLLAPAALLQRGGGGQGGGGGQAGRGGGQGGRGGGQAGRGGGRGGDAGRGGGRDGGRGGDAGRGGGRDGGRGGDAGRGGGRGGDSLDPEMAEFRRQLGEAVRSGEMTREEARAKWGERFGRGGDRGGAASGGGGGAGGEPQREPEPVDGRQVDLSQPGQTELKQVLELIGAQVEVTFEGDDQPTLVESPFSDDPDAMSDYLPVLMEYLTVTEEPTITGRININQAPRAVLLAIPGLTEEMVDQILALRDVQSTTDISRNHPTWLLTEGIVTLDQMKQLLPYVTTRGDVFRAQVVGYFDGGGVSARAQVLVDATIPLPRLLFWRELGYLGRGYPLDMLGTDLAQ